MYQSISLLDAINSLPRPCRCPSHLYLHLYLNQKDSRWVYVVPPSKQTPTSTFGSPGPIDLEGENPLNVGRWKPYGKAMGLNRIRCIFPNPWLTIHGEQISTQKHPAGVGNRKMSKISTCRPEICLSSF